MAIHAQMYSENHLGFPLMSSQALTMENGGGIVQFFQNPLQKQQWRKLEEQKKYKKQSTGLQIQNQSQCFASNFLTSLRHTSNTAINDQIPLQFYQSIATHIEKERAELDQYIKLQNERLTWALQEQVKQRVSSVLKSIESKTMILLKQKDEEIVYAAKKTTELEEFLRKLETENQAWQRVAHENEAMAISLNNILDQMRETSPCCFQTYAVEDAESGCDVNREKRETWEGNRGARKMAMICGACNSQKSCIIFLPCRHLCSCKVCDSVLGSCPVCGTGKQASVEALIF